ncbi:hypothetical protein EOM39_00955 [Candidatus Gracilibacteria bacterium]|nr:hypothetical protein [Candidatus Gracilibacteria bacterium]
MVNKIKINTSFLDDENEEDEYNLTANKNTETSRKNISNNKESSKYKPLIIISSIVFLFAAIISLGGNQETDNGYSNSSYSNNTYSDTSSDTSTEEKIIDSLSGSDEAIGDSSETEYSIGQYSCYSNAYDKAISLKPINPGLDFLESEINTLDTEIKNTYVNEYSQSSVDSYNAKVNSLNIKIKDYEEKLKNFNLQVDTYNSYLDNNCTKKY